MGAQDADARRKLGHMLKCPTNEAREARKAALAAFRAEGKRKRIPQTVIDRIHYLLTHYTQGHKGGVATPGNVDLDVATNQQKKIGLGLLSRGFLAKGWKGVMEEGGTKQPEHKMTHLQKILWPSVIVPLWNKRCKIQHGRDNRAEEANNLRVGDYIQWYVANRHNVLLAYDSKLATFDITTIHRISRDQQRQWVKHLDVAQDAYALELKQRGNNQNLITKYMVSTNEMVHNTMESDCNNEIDMDNKVVHD